MDIKSYSDGILQGVMLNPEIPDGVPVRFVGSPLDLMKVACFLGLEPNCAPEDVEYGEPISLKDENGSYATLQPVQKASDLLLTIVAEAKKRGLPPPPFI